MKTTVWYIMAGVFLVGGAAYFISANAYPELKVRVVDDEDLTVEDSLLSACSFYEFSIEGEDVESNAEVKWKIDESWSHEEVVENYKFTAGQGRKVILYVDGKMRGERTFFVEECKGVDIFIPDNIRAGDRVKLRDDTRGSIDRIWKIKNNKTRKVHDLNDHNATCEFPFDYPAEYLISVDVTMDNGEVEEFRKTITVREKRTVRSAEVAERSVEKEKEDTKSDNYVAPIVKEIKEKEEKVDVPSPSAELIDGFNEIESYELGNSLVVDWTRNTSAECLTFSNDKRTITLRDLKTDICISKLYFIANDEIKGNKVEIKIQNASEGRSRKATKTVQSDMGRATSVDIEEIGCGLAEGESYTITIRPTENSELADMDISDTDCFNIEQDYDFGDVQMMNSSKIMKMRIRYD